MTTNGEARSILFYGDSLTYGRQPGTRKRLPPHLRFTGILQELLGSDYYVIEEGLRGRTLTGEHLKAPERNGLEQFGPIVASHLPLFMVVIVLGTNNCANFPNFDAAHVAESLREYQAKITDRMASVEGNPPKVLVVLPPDVDPASYDESMASLFSAASAERVRTLRSEMRRVAEELDMAVFDASEHCHPSKVDGLHLDDKNNQLLAEALLRQIVGMVEADM